MTQLLINAALDPHTGVRFGEADKPGPPKAWWKQKQKRPGVMGGTRATGGEEATGGMRYIEERDVTEAKAGDFMILEKRG